MNSCIKFVFVQDNFKGFLLHKNKNGQKDIFFLKKFAEKIFFYLRQQKGGKKYRYRKGSLFHFVIKFQVGIFKMKKNTTFAKWKLEEPSSAKFSIITPTTWLPLCM